MEERIKCGVVPQSKIYICQIKDEEERKKHCTLSQIIYPVHKNRKLW